MFEKVSPMHPDKVADRIAGAIVDMAYAEMDNPKVAVEVLIGHGYCKIFTESNINFSDKDHKHKVFDIVQRICGIDGFTKSIATEILSVKQDAHLAKNQESEIRCGDNGIFKGCVPNSEEILLTKIAKDMYEQFKSDGKYIIDGKRLVICQSNASKDAIMAKLSPYTFDDIVINPLGEWTGGIDVDTGATNRKLGSDMGRAITGGGLCVSGDTEYISDDYKWHKIKNWNGEKVGQWRDGFLEFVTPIQYIHNANDSFIHFHNNTKLDMMLTGNHNVLVKTSRGNFIKHKAKYLADKMLSKDTCNMGAIPHYFSFSNTCIKSKYDSEELYRLQVAFCADGNITNGKGRIQVKKQYKIDRLRKLLKSIPHTETPKDKYGYTRFYFNPQILSKSLYECFADEKWDILYDEIFKWDGDEKNRLFRTTHKQDADFIQLVIQSFGKVATIFHDNRLGKEHIVGGKQYKRKSVCYCVHELKSVCTGLRMSDEKGKILIEDGGRGDSYCFTVPSHNLVLRSNDKIFITGNCGKELSKADVTLNIYCHLLAEKLKDTIVCECAIGDTTVAFRSYPDDIVYTTIPYKECVYSVRRIINKMGGFEKFAEWGLIR